MTACAEAPETIRISFTEETERTSSVIMTEARQETGRIRSSSERESKQKTSGCTARETTL